MQIFFMNILLMSAKRFQGRDLLDHPCCFTEKEQLVGTAALLI